MSPGLAYIACFFKNHGVVLTDHLCAIMLSLSLNLKTSVYLGKLQVELHGGQYANRPRWANLTLFCDPSKDDTEPTSWNFRRTTEEGILSVEWMTKYACPLDAGGSPESGSDGERHGSSIATLLGDFVLL